MYRSPTFSFHLMTLFSFLSLFGCANTQTLHEGTFNGVPYKLQSIENKGFSTNSITCAVKLGRWKAAPIDALTTDWGPPYADDLYGNTRRVYLNKNHKPYQNEPDNAVQHPSTMLYLSPSRFSEQAFAEYSAFMQSEWPNIDQQFTQSAYNRFPHIIGLVHGDQTDFVRIFRGKKEGKNYSISVEPDGRVRFEQDSQYGAEEYSGLSEKIQMPGKIIFVAVGKNAGLSMQELLTYKELDGKTLADYFTLREKP
jgi:hypothetical protein